MTTLTDSQQNLTRRLQVQVGQCSRAGRKPRQQDYCGVHCPDGSALNQKGVVVALADGISSSDVSHIASQTCVSTLLDDYYATPDTWGVSASVKKVLQSLNSWLYAQTRNSVYRYHLDKGYVCTLSGLVLRSQTATIFHVGDSRVCRVVGNALEPLTEDHRVSIGEGHSLSRAMGMREHLDLQILQQKIEVGDVFVLMTDGVYDWVSPTELVRLLAASDTDLNAAAESIVQRALDNGSDDNLSLQLVRVQQVPAARLDEFSDDQTVALPVPEALSVGQLLDDYRIQRILHANHRSMVYLASDPTTGQPLVLKVPTPGAASNPEVLASFWKEAWVAQRVRHASLSKAAPVTKERRACYLPLEYFPGQNLSQWRDDHGQPTLTDVRTIVEQVAKGVQAMHRMHMIHQDIRPQNILINKHGQIRIIDYGATRIEGLQETDRPAQQLLQGELQFSAPECLLGWPGTEQSDLYALACLTYFLLSGRLPYPAALQRAGSRSAQRKIRYISLHEYKVDVPPWLDMTLRKALHIDPAHRYSTLSEFVFDLTHPNPAFTRSGSVPFIEKHPVVFWQSVSAILLFLLLILAGTHPGILARKSELITGQSVPLAQQR
ncbi:bifunctional protein-serine/threonine kinase/phosphatase [Reinekea blandensis]|uniref:Serine/Threonine protein kinase n=1 Tax=Reinekea blandensis MED297 TaxID=314283 RepID=A4BAX8_9GAMM|nr:bifunctional protein-serine/threonine kinase/phosphatase [Reinekea blandensis]EAR10591.1 Serine/Threonine protein kinase [Reinekea sp. MED297] [Reinekea blandensis MED297]